MQLKRIPIYINEILKHERKLKISFEKNNKDLIDKCIKCENTNQYAYEKLICVDGSGCSGSSAVTDFLAEFSDCTALGGVEMRENPARGQDQCFEVDFFRDVRGIQELEKICYTANKRIINSAIYEYKLYCERLYSKNSPIFNDYFLWATKQFINNITEFVNIYPDGRKEYYGKKNLTINEYRKIANKYINAILNSIPSKKNLVLDAVMSINTPDSTLLEDYFGEFKLVYVWRDPRDVYAQARTFDDCYWVPKDPDVFVKWYLRDCPEYINSNDKSILAVRFEEFVNNYSKELEKIIQFLDLTVQNHTKQKQYFNPEISCQNIGLYKSYSDRKVIEYIESKLKEYCYYE